MCTQTHATASILSTSARLTLVAMETELHSKKQPTAKDGDYWAGGGVGGVVVVVGFKERGK